MEGGIFQAASGLTMASLITEITTFMTAVLGWLSSIIAYVAGEPLLLIFVMFVLVKIAMAVCRRWIPGL